MKRINLISSLLALVTLASCNAPAPEKGTETTKEDFQSRVEKIEEHQYLKATLVVEEVENGVKQDEETYHYTFEDGDWVSSEEGSDDYKYLVGEKAQDDVKMTAEDVFAQLGDNKTMAQMGINIEVDKEKTKITEKFYYDPLQINRGGRLVASGAIDFMGMSGTFSMDVNSDQTSTYDKYGYLIVNVASMEGTHVMNITGLPDIPDLKPVLRAEDPTSAEEEPTAQEEAVNTKMTATINYSDK